jgi:hypothetical protein
MMFLLIFIDLFFNFSASYSTVSSSRGFDGQAGAQLMSIALRNGRNISSKL